MLSRFRFKKADGSDNRFLTFDLFFTDRRPEGWHPTGFVTSQSATMLCPDQDQWKVQIASPGLANLGAHTSVIDIES